ISLLMLGGMCSCGVAEEDISSKEPEVVYEQLKVDISQKKNEEISLCYCTPTEMVFSVGVRNGAMDGPLVNTERLVLYDYQKNNIAMQFQMNTDAYIYNAMPYKDGILYSTYGETGGMSTSWKVMFINSKGTKTIDKGYARQYDGMPCFGEINGKPIYVYEDIDGESYQCGVNIINDFVAVAIFTDENYSLCGSGILPTNGTEYMLMMSKEKDDYATVVVGNEKGIIGRYPLKEKLAAYNINESYAICSTVKSQDEFSLLTIDLKEAKESNTDAGRPLFRITGGKGKSFVSVDSSFNMFAINAGKKTSKTTIEMPIEIYKGSQAVAYYPIEESKYVVSFDNKSYYRMTVIYK
ncbi:MAG: hypothetical protein RSC31_09095, partial [Anaerovoracaceae bacterium]